MQAAGQQVLPRRAPRARISAGAARLSLPPGVREGAERAIRSPGTRVVLPGLGWHRKGALGNLALGDFQLVVLWDGSHCLPAARIEAVAAGIGLESVKRKRVQMTTPLGAHAPRRRHLERKRRKGDAPRLHHQPAGGMLPVGQGKPC